MPVRLAANEELPGPLKGYRLIDRLGRGGFGEVWKVEAPGGLLKAMKFVFGDLDAIDDDESRPAEQELKALNRVKSIRHPYILSLERFDKIDGQLIIVMELADRNLWDRFRECRTQALQGIPRDELMRYMEESAEALDLMNDDYQIQHLDVKPQNIFLIHNHIKVADFGLAKDFAGDRGTITGGVTPVYAAPETFEGYVSRFTDQYSLAIVFQELLTGRRPFDGANTKQLLMQHLNGLPDLSPLSPADQPIIGRGLNKKPDDRWPSCMAMVQALKPAGSKTSSGTVGSPPDRTRVAAPVQSYLPQGSPNPTSPPNGIRQTNPNLTNAPYGPSAKSPGSSGAVVVTQRPSSTPLQSIARLVTPQAANGLTVPGQTLQREQIFQTGRMTSLGIAPPEQSGDGVLFPAVVVCVGQTGLAVVRKLRQFIREQFGKPDAIPTLRFLYIDTDPDAGSLAIEGQDALSGKDVVIAKLNRPSHYLQNSTTPNVEQWIPPNALYQLPKNPGSTGGRRAYGRLALCDNFRIVAQRIRQEIETFLTSDVLDKAGKQTGLGVRTNRLRAYVVTGLAGGTGSGMFLDLAYILKHELRSVGYRKPEVTGILLVPPADSTTPQNMALANTYAALNEVHYFSSGNRYQVKFDQTESHIVDNDGPFTRCALVQLPKGSKPKDQQQAHGLAARGLFVELLTTAGRTIDNARAAVPITGNVAAPVVQTFGLHRLAWPRSELLTQATSRFNRQLLQRWAIREASHLTEPLKEWLDGLWAKQQLAPEAVLARFQQVAQEALRESPEAVFEAAVDTLRTRTPGAGRMDATAACGVLEQLLNLVGKPDGELVGSLEATIQITAKKIGTEAEADLSTLAVSFIEQPQYRLAGAEESLNQMTRRLKHTIDTLEYDLADLQREVRDTYSRLFQLIGGLGSTSGLGGFAGRKSSLTGELLDVMRQYPTKRFQLTKLTIALSLYRGMMNNIPEYLREVNFCRIRLMEMSEAFAPALKASNTFLCGTLILPAGCNTIVDTAERVIDALPPEDILAFDQAFQREVSKNFRGLANVCLKPERGPDFIALLNTQTRAFLDARLEKTDPATILLRYRGPGEDTVELLRKAFEDAAPNLTTLSGPRPVETSILAAPPGASGDQLRKLVTADHDDFPLIAAPLADDVVFYREYSRLDLARLPQLAEHARGAYESQVNGDLSPHTRRDVPWVVPGG